MFPMTTTTTMTTTPPVPPSSERRRYAARLRVTRGGPASDYDSDEEPDLVDNEEEAFRFLEQFTVGNATLRERDTEEVRIRAHQILRGQMTNKRIASRKALAQLQSVELSTLPDSEQSTLPSPRPSLSSISSLSLLSL